MGWFDETVEHRLQRREFAAVSGDAGGGVLRGIHADPVDVVPGVMGQLGNKRPLPASVSLAEWVQRIDVTQQLGESRDEQFAGQTAEPIGGGQPANTSAP